MLFVVSFFGGDAYCVVVCFVLFGGGGLKGKHFRIVTCKKSLLVSK